MESGYPELLAELLPYIFYSGNWDTLLGDVISDYVNINKYLTVTMCIKKVGDFAYVKYVSR